MEFFLNRYRNLSVLLVAILLQLALLGYQVKTNQDVRLIKVWAVTLVTPLARVIESSRGGISGFFHDYFVLLGVREENKRIQADLDRTELENQYLRTQLSTAENAQALAIFQASSQSKTLPAHIIANTPDTGGKTVMVDRGSSAGVQKGMAVIKPEGIVGKVIDVYPITANVLLITDASFAAGVISANNRVHGVLKGQGHGTVTIDYVQNEQKVDQGEWFLTSGDDLIFPRGLKVGQVTVVKAGQSTKEIYLIPSGMQNGLEDVLIVTEGVHGVIPETPLPNQPVHLLAPPPSEGGPITDASGSGSTVRNGSLLTDLDRQVQQDRAIGEAQRLTFGDKNSHAPNFNAPIEAAPRPAASPPPAGPPRHP
jgi:rod shape-determining protein MreC